MEEKINSYFARFAFHLYDTHGIPLQVFKDWFQIDGYWKTEKLFRFIEKHKDFIRQEKENAKKVRGYSQEKG